MLIVFHHFTSLYCFYLIDVNVKGGQDELRPLHMACRYNSATAVQVLLAHLGMVNIKDIKGKTPLHYATRRGHDMSTKVSNHVCSLLRRKKATVLVYRCANGIAQMVESSVTWQC